MVTSRSVPQQTAQIFSALAGQNRSALRFPQIGQDTHAPPGADDRSGEYAEERQNTKGRRAAILTKGSEELHEARIWPHPADREHPLRAPEGFLPVGGCFLFCCWASPPPTPAPALNRSKGRAAGFAYGTQAMMTLLWKRRAAMMIRTAPMAKSASASNHRCRIPAPRRMMPRVMLMK